MVRRQFAFRENKVLMNAANSLSVATRREEGG